VSPQFKTLPAPAVGDLMELLPEQGSFELQHDQSGKTHNWHFHSLDEELFILTGAALLFWVDQDGGYHQQDCTSGTWITLPAGTRHGSVAGPDGAIYMIRPEGGQTARTTFLDPGEHPYPAPAFSAEDA
jgi:quercetin dioxygenase-like cupin family protein